MFDFYYFIYRSMMKKNLFILFSFYFFVVQPSFLWLLWWDMKFFYLSAINLISILIISILSKEKKIEDHEKKIDRIEKVYNIQKNRTYKKISHIRFLIISVLFGVFVWFWFWDIVLHFRFLIVVASSFVLFILFGLLFKFRSLKVWESKLYMLILIIWFIWSMIKMLGIDLHNISDSNDLDIIENTGIETSFVSVDEDLTGNVLEELDIQDNIVNDADLTKKAMFSDAIKYLIDINEISLNTLKNIKFTYIAYSNPDYAYYKIAYDKKMIWKTLNPSKNLLCETYVVMRWLAEWWSVTKSTDIKQSYWDYAKNNNKLPICKYWEFLTIADLR